MAEPCKRFGPNFRRQLAEPVGPLRFSSRKLQRRANRSGHASAGNSLSLLVPRLISCNFLSPEKTSAGNSLSSFSHNLSSCKLLSPEKTSAGSSLSLLLPKSIFCKLLSPANRLVQTSTGNSLSSFRPRPSSRNLLSPEKDVSRQLAEIVIAQVQLVQVTQALQMIWTRLQKAAYSVCWHPQIEMLQVAEPCKEIGPRLQQATHWASSTTGQAPASYWVLKRLQQVASWDCYPPAGASATCWALQKLQQATHWARFHASKALATFLSPEKTLADNSLRSFLLKYSICKLPSPANDLDQTSEGSLLSLLAPRLRCLQVAEPSKEVGPDFSRHLHWASSTTGQAPASYWVLKDSSR